MRWQIKVKRKKMNKNYSGAWLRIANKFIREFCGQDTISGSLSTLASYDISDILFIEMIACAMAKGYKEARKEDGEEDA